MHNHSSVQLLTLAECFSWVLVLIRFDTAGIDISFFVLGLLLIGKVNMLNNESD